MMQVSSIEGNTQWLDGGAMFGNAPRALWQRWAEPDAQGRIALSCRCFLVETDERKVLIETGVGAFFSPSKKERYGVVESAHKLVESLDARGVSRSDIDVVILSHLHFDHAGGLLSAYDPAREPSLIFPRAQFVVGSEAWRRAQMPHQRDRASFIEVLPRLLEESGRLTIVSADQSASDFLGDGITFFESHGHTPGMLLPILHGASKKAVFCADLVPGTAWVHAPLSMGYDRFPERLVDEKVELYGQLGTGTWLLFTHDPKVAAGQLIRDDHGKYGVAETQASLDTFSLDL